MNFYMGFLAWAAIGVVLGFALLMAVKGSVWLLVLGLVAFVVAITKIGCATH